MNPKIRDWVVLIVFGIAGSFYMFLPAKMVKSLGLTLGLRHNDHVMIGIIALILAVAALYGIVIRSIENSSALKKKKK
ncbi:hypothetical protein HYV84_04985 [Candidatus Woesearchaeota archaeon]|nr:hypothetical protein [Candidatus Woesearchaeota archaeon]